MVYLTEEENARLEAMRENANKRFRECYNITETTKHVLTGYTPDEMEYLCTHEPINEEFELDYLNH